MVEKPMTKAPRRSDFGSVLAWVGIGVILLILLPPLIGTEIPLGHATVAAYNDPRSAQEGGFSHFRDPVSEGWLLRLGNLHWVFGLTR